MSAADPWRIRGPACVSFSGGRTSGYMLWQLLEKNRPWPKDAHVIFADTQKERPETLTFVRQVEYAFGVPIHWVTFPGGFEAFIETCKAWGWKNVLPGPRARMCTAFLKIFPQARWMLKMGYDAWDCYIGLRADEPRRVSNMRANSPMRRPIYPELEKPGTVTPLGNVEVDYFMPMAEAGQTHDDVNAFWKAQAFDLDLKPWEGNCDFCFMKGVSALVRLAADRPDLLEWWETMERTHGETFVPGLPFAEIRKRGDFERRQVKLPLVENYRGVDCLCTD